MKVCVVGGTGNISTSIVRLLLEFGHDVTVFNRGRTRSLPDGVRRIEGDRKHRPAFEAAIKAEKFEAAIDMLCFDAEDARSSVRAFQGVEYFVHCSTVCTYGVDYDWLPVTEDHPLRPTTEYGRNKAAADRVLLAAHYGEDFPVTIIKPSTTMGPSWFLLRQIAWEGAWVDRVRKGKPIVICGDGRALHQWLHVDDAAPAFVHALGRERCLGQTYNLMKREFGSWEEYHQTAMKVIGREVELVGVSLAGLKAAGVPGVGICDEIFSHNTIYSPERLMRDLPEFRPRISLEETMAEILMAMEREGRVPDSDQEDWEDRLIAAQRASVGSGS